jgi:tetratricopeptide (TPR) repeat protein
MAPAQEEGEGGQVEGEAERTDAGAAEVEGEAERTDAGAAEVDGEGDSDHPPGDQTHPGDGADWRVAEEAPRGAVPQGSDAAAAVGEAVAPSSTLRPEWREQIEALEAAGDLPSALSTVQGLLDAAPDSAALRFRQVSLLGQLGRLDEAEAELARIRKAEGESRGVRVAQSLITYRRGRYLEAEAELRAVCDEIPEGRLYYYLGETLNRLDRADEAIQVLKRALELDGSDPRPYHTLGRLYDRKSMPDEAAAMYRMARELGP